MGSFQKPAGKNIVNQIPFFQKSRISKARKKNPYISFIKEKYNVF